MQALSLGWHIMIVCFGVAFPAIVLFAEGLYLRTGDPIYKTLAKRWSKAMLVLFAVGVVSGTILSFEFGILWPEFMATFGDVFGLAFALEGFSFFVEAIFIAIYVYGWDRLPRRAHFLAGLPMVAAGLTGSLFVLSVNGWMNQPTGFDLVNGKVTDVRPWAALFNDNLWHEVVHMTLGAYMVAGFSVAGVYAWGWLRGRRDRYHRIGLVIPFTIAALAAPAQVVVGDWAARTVAEAQPTKLAALEGLGTTTEGAPIHLLGWYRDGEVVGGIEIPRLLSHPGRARPRRHRPGARRGAGRPAAAGQRGPLRLPGDGGHRHRADAARRPLPGHVVAASPSAPIGVVPSRRRRWPAPPPRSRSSAAGSPPRWGGSPGSSTASCAWTRP